MRLASVILGVVLFSLHVCVAACGRAAPPPPSTVSSISATTPPAHEPGQVQSDASAQSCVLVDEAGKVLDEHLDEAAMRALLGQQITLKGGVDRRKPGDFMGCPNAEVLVHVEDPSAASVTATGVLTLVWEAHYHKSGNDERKPGEPHIQDYGSGWMPTRFELKSL